MISTQQDNDDPYPGKRWNRIWSVLYLLLFVYCIYDLITCEDTIEHSCINYHENQ